MADTLDVITLTEAKTATGITTTTWDTPLAQAVTAISRQLDTLCGPIVNRTITNETHSGGHWTIQLRHRPVASITTVTEYDGTNARTLTAETNAAKPTDAYLHDGTLGTLRSGLLRRRSNDTDEWFEPGRRNIEVTYVAGRAANTAAVSARFKQAAVMMLRNIWTAEMASGTDTFGAFAEQQLNPLLGPGMLNKVAALLDGDIIEGPFVA